MTLLKPELSENERAVNLAFNDAVVSPGKGGLTRGKKAVLFEKTTKKLFTFPHLHKPDAAEKHRSAEAAREQKFFASFFQKRRPCLLS